MYSKIFPEDYDIEDFMLDKNTSNPFESSQSMFSSTPRRPTREDPSRGSRFYINFEANIIEDRSEDIYNQQLYTLLDKKSKNLQLDHANLSKLFL